MNIFNKLMGRDSNDLSTVFSNDNKTTISATTAYQKSRFGVVKTDKELLEEFFVDIRNLIEQKNFKREYCGLVEVNSDIIIFLPKITERLSNELGFKVIVLDDNCEVINKVTGTKDTLKCGSTFIMLIWNKQAIEEVAAINAAKIAVTDNKLMGPDEDKSSLTPIND